MIKIRQWYIQNILYVVIMLEISKLHLYQNLQWGHAHPLLCQRLIQITELRNFVIPLCTKMLPLLSWLQERSISDTGTLLAPTCGENLAAFQTVPAASWMMLTNWAMGIKKDTPRFPSCPSYSWCQSLILMLLMKAVWYQHQYALQLEHPLLVMRYGCLVQECGTPHNDIIHVYYVHAWLSNTDNCIHSMIL